MRGSSNEHLISLNSNELMLDHFLAEDAHPSGTVASLGFTQQEEVTGSRLVSGIQEILVQRLRFAVSCFDFTCGIFGGIILDKHKNPLLTSHLLVPVLWESQHLNPRLEAASKPVTLGHSS